MQYNVKCVLLKIWAYDCLYTLTVVNVYFQVVRGETPYSCTTIVFLFHIWYEAYVIVKIVSKSLTNFKNYWLFIFISSTAITIRDSERYKLLAWSRTLVLYSGHYNTIPSDFVEIYFSSLFYHIFSFVRFKLYPHTFSLLSSISVYMEIVPWEQSVYSFTLIM